MNQSYPVPPPELVELVQQWRKGGPTYALANNAYEHHIATQAAQWGADQELEACKQFMHDQDWFMSPTLRMSQLHNARRPKSPSLKEQALKALTAINSNFHVSEPDASVIRRALEQLPD